MFRTPSMHVILYTTLSRRSLARIITVSKCPAQGMTMFPRRRNILLAISKSATAGYFVSLFSPLPPLSYRIYAPKICDGKVQNTLSSTLFAKRKKENACLYV